MRQVSISQALRVNKQPILLICAVALTMFCISGLLYARAKNVMEAQLRETLRSTAAAAAMQFRGEDLDVIRGRDQMHLPIFISTVGRLKEIRSNVPNIRFAYIMRRTEDENVLTFVADADSLSTPSQLDANKNGVLEDSEMASLPGDLYNIADVPMIKEAFLHPAVDDTFTYDQWGRTISGYAPIMRSDNGKIVAILGLDMDANTFEAVSESVLSPLLSFLLAIAVTMIGAYLFLFLMRRRITEWRKFDEERAGLMLLTFHQLGGPLTIFKWSLEALRFRDPEESLEDAVKEHIQNMEQGISRMDLMLADLKEAAQVQEGKVDLVLDRARLRDVIRTLVDELNETSKHHILLDIREDFPMLLDAKLVRNVLTQLLTNAQAYSPRGSTIMVRARRVEDHVQVEVEDHGSGIPDEDLPRIFHKFARGSNAPRYRPDGNGLGLFIAKGLVRRAGGKIWLESEVGRGTTFYFTLPLGPKETQIPF
jgi:signal transduction histidine kinase